MVVAFARVWWTARVGALAEYPEGSYWVHIFGWGIQKQAETAEVVGLNGIVGDATPSTQMILAWVFLAACVAVVLLGSWLRGWKGSVLLGIAGLAFAAYAWVALHVVVAHRVYLYGVPLSGWVDRGDPLSPNEALMSVPVTTDIRFGWYMALAAGIVCIVLAVVRVFLMNTSNTPADKFGKNDIES
jgi:hypothetical protein